MQTFITPAEIQNVVLIANRLADAKVNRPENVPFFEKQLRESMEIMDRYPGCYSDRKQKAREYALKTLAS